MSALDLIVIAAIVFASLIGLWLGVVRVLLGIGGWIGAAVITVYGFPFIRPLARSYIEGAFLSDLAAAGSIFIVSLVLLTILSHMIAERVRGSAFGAVDKSVGLIVGLALGILITSSGFLVMERVLNLPENESKRPKWVQNSKTAPVLGWSARAILSIVPKEWRRASGTDGAAVMSAEEIGKAAEKLMTPMPRLDAKNPKAGYSSSERREMDRLINANQ